MNSGEINHLKNGLFTKMNRIRKLSKLAKGEVHEVLYEDLNEQDFDMAESRFISMIEEISLLSEQARIDYLKLKNNDD